MSSSKNISFKINSSSEPAFYFNLYRLLENKDSQPEEVKAFLDLICYDKMKADEFINLTMGQKKMIYKGLLKSWKYLYEANRFHENYRLVSLESFSSFRKSPFGKELISAYYFLSKVQQYWDNENVLEVRIAMGALIHIFNQFLKAIPEAMDIALTHSLNMAVNIGASVSNPGNYSVEVVGDGIFAVKTADGENIKLVEIFYEVIGSLNQVHDLQMLSSLKSIDAVYYKSGSSVTKIAIEGEEQVITNFENVEFKNGKFDFSRSTLTGTFKIPKEGFNYSINEHEDKLKVEMNLSTSVEVSSDSVKDKATHQKEEKETSIDQFDLLNVFSIPKEEKKKELYKRDVIIKGILEVVARHFPAPVSEHVRYHVTGYLCIPFGILDSEDLHIDSDRKSGTYHNYIGKTVKNALARKSYRNTF